MKILTVAIPNHHFFQWVNQLEEAGYELYWFDITDSGPSSQKIPWVTQIKGWRLRYDFPLRSRVKKYFPKAYKYIQKLNENAVDIAFAKALKTINPDIIHCFEMQLSGLPIYSIIKDINVPLIYSSWGSDLYDYERLGMSNSDVNNFLGRVDFLVTDCIRDKGIASQNGFKGQFLGVFPGNGGLSIKEQSSIATSNRKNIIIKGYDNGVGQAIVVLKALELVPYDVLKTFKIIIYSADKIVEKYVNNATFFKNLEVRLYPRYRFIDNEELLIMMGESAIHIASSLSDGMPNALLEAMAMGAFPIQSNPGGATQEVITDGENGFLIKNPLDTIEIAHHIEAALVNEGLRTRAQKMNTTFIQDHYSRRTLQPQIIALYKEVYNKQLS